MAIIEGESVKETLDNLHRRISEIEAEIERDTRALLHDLDRKELALVLSGPHDSNNALLAIHAREGGVEAQDWGEMLLRMYTRWGETRGWKVDLVDLTE